MTVVPGAGSAMAEEQTTSLPPPPRYHAIEIGPVNFAYGINGKGEVVGRGPHPTPGLSRAYVWLPEAAYGLDAGVHFLDPINPSENSEARSINDDGTIVGRWDFSDAFVFHGRVALWQMPAEPPGDILAFDLGAPIPENPYVLPRMTITNDSLIVGSGTAAVPTCPPLPPCPGPAPAGELEDSRTRAWTIDWSMTSAMTILPCPGSIDGHCWAYGASNEGLIVGEAWGGTLDECPEQPVCPEPPEGCIPGVDPCCGCTSELPFHWDGAASGGLTGLCEPRAAAGMAANDLGHIVGRASDWFASQTCLQRAVLWPSAQWNLEPVILPDPPGEFEPAMIASAISNALADGVIHVVGRNASTNRAMLWRAPANAVENTADWEAYDLNHLLCDDGGFVFLREATAINDMGWIVGWGETAQHTRAFLLVPIDTCPGDLTGPGLGLPDGKVDVFDLLELLQRWGDCVNPMACCADLDGNGTVNVFDMLALLMNWGNCPMFAGNRYVPSREEVTSSVGITEQRWEEFLDVLTYEPMEEQERWICWFERRVTQCQVCRPCRGSDPFN